MNVTELFRAAAAMPRGLYIDPSAVTVAVSSIGGVAIAVGTAVVIWWRRAKKKAAKVLHIDENANKEVEQDLVVKSDEELRAETPAEPDSETPAQPIGPEPPEE